MENVRRVIKRNVKPCKIRWRGAAQSGNCQVPCVLSSCTSQVSTRTATTLYLPSHPDLSWATFKQMLEPHPHEPLPQVTPAVGHTIIVSAMGSLNKLASMIRKMVIQMTVKCVTMDEDLANTPRRNWMAQSGFDLNLQAVLVWAQQLTRNGHVEAQRGARRGQVAHPSKLVASGAWFPSCRHLTNANLVAPRHRRWLKRFPHNGKN